MSINTIAVDPHKRIQEIAREIKSIVGEFVADNDHAHVGTAGLLNPIKAALELLYTGQERLSALLDLADEHFPHLTTAERVNYELFNYDHRVVQIQPKSALVHIDLGNGEWNRLWLPFTILRFDADGNIYLPKWYPLVNIFKKAEAELEESDDVPPAA